jgi:inosose dehydratase
LNPVSCHLITWGNDLELGLREAAELGFRACETFTHLALAYEDRIEEFKELLAAHGLRLSALYAGGRFSDPEQFDEVIAFNTRVANFLTALGVDRIVFGPRGPRDGKTSAAGLKQMGRTIDESAKRTADLGVLACVHPHLGTELQDEEELLAVMESTDPAYVHFCPDTAHLTAAGMDAAEVIRRYGSRIRYVHLKDLTPDDPNPAVFASTGVDQLPIFCELGLGTIDFEPIMAALRDVGYAGWLTVEIDKSTCTPFQSLRQCRDYMEQRLGIPVAVTL